MITLTRRQARGLRGVLRRAALGLPGRGPAPPLVLRAGGAQLRAQYRYAGLAVEHALDGSFPAQEAAVALPLDALGDVEGRDETPVTIEALARDRTAARWADRGIPQAREYAVEPVDALAPFPDPPTSWSECPAALLDALAEAARTGTAGSTRYALDCILLKGGEGGHEVAATDGQQLLTQGGSPLPWAGDVLVRRAPVFGCKALPRDRPLAVGRTDTHVVLRAGPWTLYLEIITGARFPDLARVLPGPSAPATRLRLDPDDARFLLPALERLPGGDGVNAPVTLDLNGRVVIRARGEGGGPATELVLTRSGYAGDSVRVSTNRAYLARALRLGFDRLDVAGPGAPLVCRDDRRVFAWQPLNADSVVEPADDVTRILSDATDPGPARTVAFANEGSGPMNNADGRPREAGRAHHGPDGAGHTGGAAAPGAGLAALLAEAVSLHAALGDARARAARLTAALRRHRKRERLVASTLASLRELKLTGVDG
jgi:hypothetical protein